MQWAGLRIFVVVCSAVCGVPTPALAGAPIHAKHLTVQLVADAQTAAPGASFDAGLLFHLEKGWHIYWRNAGDYGEPPRVTWDAMDGVRVGEIAWPRPRRFQVGPIVSFGYEDEVLLPVHVEIAPDWKAARGASVVELKAHARWLVCREICVPGEANLNLGVPVGDLRSTVEADGAWAPLFSATLKMVPGPAPRAWVDGAHVEVTRDDIDLRLGNLGTEPGDVGFLPFEGDQIDLAAQPVARATGGGGLELKFKRSDRLVKAPTHMAGLVVTGSGAYEVDLPVGSESRMRAALLPILFAFLGGLLLNLMPCVFPVLSIKVMSLVRGSAAGRAELRAQAWSYAAGILVSFWIVVAALLILRAGGAQIGWGFQLQSPRFVLALACLFFVLGLSLIGVFEIAGSFMGFGSELTSRSGHLGSFFTGALATVVATPCTAPFMGSAVGYALAQPPALVFAIFSSLAVGLAAPYLAVCHLPALGRILPKPGPWMAAFSGLMGFCLFGAVVWLAWVLTLQAGPSGVVVLLLALLAVGLCSWVSCRWPGFRGASAVAVVATTLLAASVVGRFEPRAADSSASLESGKDGLVWERFTPELLARYRSEGRPVFVDFTAAWCVSCQVNELVVFGASDVRRAIREGGLALLKADWTNYDPVITKTLAEFGRDGVPFYLVYGKGKQAPAHPLPEVITPGLVLTELEKIK